METTTEGTLKEILSVDVLPSKHILHIHIGLYAWTLVYMLLLELIDSGGIN